MLTGAIAACGSRSGIEQLALSDIGGPELEVAAAPDDTTPPAEAEPSAPAASLGAATGCVDITRRYARRFYQAVEPFVGGDTPTADAIDVAVSTLTSAETGPARYVLLLTDGVPDTCAERDPQNGFDDAVDAVVRAREQGIRVKAVGVSPEIERRGLQRMANAAAGKPLGPAAACSTAASNSRSNSRVMTSASALESASLGGGRV